MNVEGIVLAAGLSKRTGEYKMTLSFKGKTIIEGCIEGMYDICSKIIVVGGYNYDVIAEILNKYSKVKLVYNENYKNGMFSSIKEGLKYIDEERFFLIPGDYPIVKKETYEKMLRIDEDIVIPTYNYKKGHPVLIKSYLIPEILTNSKYISLRDFINEHGFYRLETGDSGVLEDIDTMEDYENLFYFHY